MEMITNPSLSQKRKPPIPFFRKRKWMSDHGHPHLFPFPEEEGVCMAMTTTTRPLCQKEEQGIWPWSQPIPFPEEEATPPFFPEEEVDI